MCAQTPREREGKEGNTHLIESVQIIIFTFTNIYRPISDNSTMENGLIVLKAMTIKPNEEMNFTVCV